jgi:hypothetical protein
MAQAPQYLDDNGNPVKSNKPLAPAPGKVYLNPETGEPLANNQASAPPVSAPPLPEQLPSQEGFLSSLAAPFVGVAKGLKSAVYEGPQNPQEAAIVGANEKNPSWQSPILGRAILAAKRILVDPQIDQGKQAASEFKQAGAKTPWYSPTPSPTATPHREMALAHGLAAAIPMLGPWAAQVGQKEGEQLGTGNYTGAAGTAFGNAALALTPKAVGGVKDLIPGAVRRLAGSGPGVARDLVRQVAEDNRRINIDNAGKQANRTAAENTLDLRRQHEQTYQQATTNHYAKEQAADTQAKSEENTAWLGWRQKTAGKTLDGGQIVGPLQKLRLDSPEVDRTLNQLEPRGDEVPQESPYAQIREQAAQQHFGKDYESLSPVKQDQVDDLLHANGHSPEPIAFDPQAGQPISIDRVQRASSILQRYIRGGRFEGPLLGEMKQVAGVLRNAVTRASADAGAAAELNAARKSTITYQQAFGRERRTPVTARTVREQQVNPEAYRDRTNEERLAKARNYDPTLVDSYRQVRASREALKKFSSEEQLRRGLQQPTPTRTISANDIRRANESSVQRRGSSAIGSLVRLSVIWPAFHMLSDLMRGHEVSPGGLAAIPAAGATGAAIDEILTQPSVREFLLQPSRAQVAQIPLELRGQMPQIVAVAKSHGVPVSPLLAAYASTIQRNQGGQTGQIPQSDQQPAQSQGAPQ